VGEYTCTLEEIDSGSIPLVGGKGANLGELTRAKLPVPHAFCVNTLAYQRLIEVNSLLAPILSVLEGLDYDDAAEIERRAMKLREMIMAADTPDDIDSAIRNGYGQLESQLGEDVLVSVRSSATAEDLPGMSFAGQQDTYLNIHGADNVLHHVKRCWASLWTDRAVSYRHRQGFRHEDVLLAVVVQEMFPSDVAGVMFTANPVTSNPGEMFLNTSWGLGEAIVSGKVNPDQYIIDKDTLAIKDKRIHEKLVMTVKQEDGQGSAEVEVPIDIRSVETLPDEKIKELSEIALRIEEHYGFPQDIEWGYSEGRFAILQSREVTAANIDFREGLEVWQTPKALADQTNERWIWSRAYSDEVQTGPSSPLFYTQLQMGMTYLKISALNFTEVEELLGYKSAEFADMPLFRWYGARAYYNTAYEKERIRLFIPPFARDDAALWPFPEEEREQIKGLPFNWVRFIWMMLKLHITNPKISLIETTHHMYEGLEKWTDHAEAVWAELDLETASPKEILATQMRAAEGSEFGTNVVLPFTIYLYVLPAALRKLCELWCDDEDGQIYNHLLAGLHTKTSEENIAVWKLSRKAKASPGLMELVQNADASEILRSLEESEDGRQFKAELDVFLEEYGHRGGAERDPIHHRWRHKPELVFHSIKPMLALGEEDDPAVFEQRLQKRMLKTKEECLERIGKQPLGFLKAAFFKWFVNLTQDYFYYRDYERFYNDKNMSRPREMYTAIAKNFIKRGLMTDPEDIFFLGKEEVVAVDDGKLSAKDIELRVGSRRRVYERYTNREPPKYIRGWETFDDDRLPDDGQGLRGIAASSGVVTGRARVCRKLEEIYKVEKGDILITVATDPGWTTVFSIIGGVVVETGGVVAHAVMISREYGIPCVANLTQACDLIPDGQMITVDGNNGRVVIDPE
jgi:pyruvate,water dikinase